MAIEIAAEACVQRCRVVGGEAKPCEMLLIFSGGQHSEGLLAVPETLIYFAEVLGFDKRNGRPAHQAEMTHGVVDQSRHARKKGMRLPRVGIDREPSAIADVGCACSRRGVGDACVTPGWNGSYQTIEWHL